MARSPRRVTGVLLAGVLACGGGAGEEVGYIGTPATAQPSPEYTGPDLSDANILALLDHANQADSSAGAVAAAKGTDQRVRLHARTMMADHHRLRRQGAALVKKLNIIVQPPADDPLTSLALVQMDALKAAETGSGFDRTYLQHDIAMHETMLEQTTQALHSAGNAELRALLEHSREVIGTHLARARSLLASVEGTT